MANINTFTENLVLTWAMTASAATRPTTWYLGLFTVTPTAAGGGTELSGNGYSRQSITFGTASGGVISNTNSITFGPDTTADWGAIAYCAVMDASTAGNMLWFGSLTASRTLAVGDTMTFAAAALSLSLS